MRTGGRSGDTLCCCEYDGGHGERSHILACCCDCEALDHACERFLTCKSIPQETLDQVMLTISDRLRIPWCNGKGAVKVPLDVAVPVVCIPVGLLIATISPVCSVVVLTVMPVMILVFYRQWTRSLQKQRTRFFYIWGLTSAILMLYIFETIVIAFREILLWENMLLITIYVLMMYALYHARKSPGVLHRETSATTARTKPPRHHDHRFVGKEDAPNGGATIDVTEEENDSNMFGPVGKFMIENLGFDQDNFQQNYQEAMEEKDIVTIPADDVYWVDSRSVESGRLSQWCPQCKVKRPPRSGHCPACVVCVRVRDHHCVWIDNCIGASNHRSFFFALIFFIIGGFYGSHLTLTSVCTPEIYFDWFLLPNDCRFLYADFPTALSFVSACYTMLASCGMTLVLVNQVFLISQNLTGQELHMAHQRGWAHWICFAKNNINNRGFWPNWRNFLFGRRKYNQTYSSVAV